VGVADRCTAAVPAAQVPPAVPRSLDGAAQLAGQRGLKVRESSTATSYDYKSLITLRSGSHSVAGTLITVGLRTGS